MTLLTTLQQWWRKPTEDQWQDLTDGQLLQQFLTDDEPGAMDELVQRHSEALYHFLLTMSDASLADDICQQVWLTLIEKPQRFQQTNAEFRTWLFTVGRNSVIDELRRQKRWQWAELNESDLTDAPHWQDDLTFTDREDLAAAFNQALEKLSFHQREALTLQLEGFSLIDIAHITAEKTETIKSRLRFARVHLKQKLEVHHDSLR